jgi:NitT/TauT family transport system substrate-binding protein
VEEREAVTTVLVSSARMMSGGGRALTRRFVAAHAELTAWIRAHPEEAQRMLRDELRAGFRAEIAPEILGRAWERMTVTAEVSPTALQNFVAATHRVGFLRTLPDLSRLVEAP